MAAALGPLRQKQPQVVLPSEAQVSPAPSSNKNNNATQPVKPDAFERSTIKPSAPSEAEITDTLDLSKESSATTGAENTAEANPKKSFWPWSAENKNKKLINKYKKLIKEYKSLENWENYQPHANYLLGENNNNYEQLKNDYKVLKAKMTNLQKLNKKSQKYIRKDQIKKIEANRKAKIGKLKNSKSKKHFWSNLFNRNDNPNQAKMLKDFKQNIFENNYAKLGIIAIGTLGLAWAIQQMQKNQKPTPQPQPKIEPKETTGIKPAFSDGLFQVPATKDYKVEMFPTTPYAGVSPSMYPELPYYATPMYGSNMFL